MRLITNTSIFVITIFILPAICFSQDGQKKGEWEKIFNGKNLEGWNQLGGKAKFYVDNEEIIGVSKPNSPSSYLATKKHFSDFILKLEVKVDTAMNSGIQIRSNSHKDGTVFGYQVEIDPSERAWSGGIYDQGRRGWIYNLKGKSHKEARKAFKNGQWNKYRIMAVGDSIKTWVNGIQAADLKDSVTASGFIAIQVHHTENEKLMKIRVRNIRIMKIGQ